MTTGTPKPSPVTTGRRTLLQLATIGGVFALAPLWHPALRSRNPETDLNIHASPRELANLPFSDGQGGATSLAAFRGRVVLLNIWATWCPPCRTEMPALDRLQATLGGPDFEVVALSIDLSGMPTVQAFFERVGIKHLRLYIDATGTAASMLASGGVPLTLLLDGTGREIARKLGPAAWDDPIMIRAIRGQIPGAVPTGPASGSPTRTGASAFDLARVAGRSARVDTT